MSTVKKQPTTTESISGADIVVRSLVHHGVDTVFSYPGGCVIPLHQAMTRHRDQIRVILPRHEQGCGFGAQGYARTTGKVGVCTATSGPGATNLLTTIADAKMDSIPIVAITGQVGTNVIGCDAFQETPIVEVCRSVTKHHYLVTDVKDIARVIREAFHVASTGRKGPVLIDIPKNVQMDHAVPDYDAPMELPGFHIPPTARPEQIAQVVAALRLAKRPVIYAGGGVIASDASEEVTQLARTLKIPVTTTMKGIGCFPGDDPLSLDMLGMHGSVYANYAVNEADLLLALGVRFDDRVTGRVADFAKHGKIIHIDIDPSEINKIKTAHIPVISDVKSAIAMVNEQVAEDKEAPLPDTKPWLEKIDKWKEQDPFTYNHESESILAQEAIDQLWQLTKDKDAIIATGVGQHQMWTTQFYKFRKPGRFLSSCGLGTMGFGMPTAMGAKAANPDKLVIDIDGDGSILMNIQEMATCHCEKLPIKVLLLNNMHLGMVVQWEDRFNAGNRAHTYLGPIDHPEAIGQGDGIGPEERYPDFVKIAEGFGWRGRRVWKKNELIEALQEMLESEEPYLLDVQVPYQEHVLPMIPPGLTIGELIRE